MSKFKGYISNPHWSIEKVYDPNYSPSFKIILETLKHLPDNEVRDFIIEHSGDDLLFQLSSELVKMDSTLIKLSIAQHSSNKDVLENLYLNFSETPIGLSALRNKNWKDSRLLNGGASDLMQEIILRKPIIQAIAILSNPGIEPTTYSPVLFRTLWGDSISEERYLICLSAILSNPSLKTLGKFGEEDKRDAFWNLFESWPVIDDWIDLLWLKLVKDSCYLPSIRFHQLKNICSYWSDASYKGDKLDSHKLGLIRSKLVSLSALATVSDEISRELEWFLFNEDEYIREGCQESYFIPSKYWEKCYEIDSHNFLHNILRSNFSSYFGEHYSDMNNFLSEKCQADKANYGYISEYKRRFEHNYENWEGY